MEVSPSDLVDRFEEAAVTLKRVPAPANSGPQGYGSSWPDYVRDAKQAYGWHGASIRVVPSPAEIDRMDEAIDWLRFVDPVAARIIWMRAEGQRWMPICRAFGISRATAWRRWTAGLLSISKALKSKRKKRRMPAGKGSGRSTPAQPGGGAGDGGAT